MPFRVDVLFSGPVPDDEMERTDLIGKVLPDIRALREQMHKVGLEITLTVKTVNSVPGRPRGKAAARLDEATRSRRHLAAPIETEAERRDRLAMEALQAGTQVNYVTDRAEHLQQQAAE
jgi:hypothetical protein